MLQDIRDKTMGWIAIAIVGLIAMAFILSAVGSYSSGGGPLVAATVNGEDIPVRQVQNFIQELRRRRAPEHIIKQQSLEGAVTQTLLRQEAELNGYRASNQEVYDYISKVDGFQKNGEFDPATYELVLKTSRMNKAGYEAGVRTEITHEQFTQAIKSTAFIPSQQVAHYQKLQNQLRDVEIFTIKQSAYESEVKVSEDEIKTQYETNAANYMTREKVKLNYVLLTQADLAKAVTVDDDALQTVYNENLSNYVESEKRKVAHILVKTGDDEVKAKQKIESLSEQIKAGTKSFEDIASSESDDSVAAKKAGEISLVSQDSKKPLFEEQVFALKKGEISEPVKTENGFEIIKLIDVIAKRQKTFDEVKADLEKTYRRDQAESQFYDKAEQMDALAFESGSSLDEVADTVGVEIQSSEWIKRGQPAKPNDVFSHPKLIEAAFSDKVLVAGKNSDKLEIKRGTAIVVRLQEHKVPAQKPLTEVKDIINSELLAQKLRKLVISKGEAVLKTLKESADWAALESIGATADKIETKAGVKRGGTSTKLAGVVVEKIFSMQKPDTGKKTFSNAILQDGDYVLIGLSAVKDGESETTDMFQKVFVQMLGSRERTAMLKALREQAEVELFPENIQ